MDRIFTSEADLLIPILSLMNSFLTIHLQVHVMKIVFFFIFLVLRLSVKVTHASISLDLGFEVLLDSRMSEFLVAFAVIIYIHRKPIVAGTL